MKEMRQVVVLGVPAKTAFSFTTNPENTPSWVDGVVKEVANEMPPRLGTIYKNQGKDGAWVEFEVTDFEDGKMFELTKKGDSVHVKYTFSAMGYGRCELEYSVHVDEGTIPERFSPESIQAILSKLKEVIETKF